ncbi:hypothetical protein JR338_08815 [Chloroflexota bacterium]|nr:hypothetical protein JR338_08815 [Chloroflexota bacterium]
MDFTSLLNQIIDLQKRVEHLNPLFERHYPVAIAVDGQFLIHEFDPQTGGYVLTQSTPVPFPIPEGIRAAFPMEALNGRSAAVVTPDAFDSLIEQVLVLHEFVHCYQHLTCEQSLRDRLELARQEEAKGHHTWELDTPFPYESEAFTKHYGANLLVLKADNEAEALQARAELHSTLSPLDWEYMVWQEWKEGYARHVENKIQRELGLKVNTYGEEPPYNRITFYVGGAAYFDYLAKREPEALTDLPGLFDRLLNWRVEAA